MIDRATWRRGVALFLLVVAAGVFYMASKVQESSIDGGGELVFRPEPAAPQPPPEPVEVAAAREPAVETAGAAPGPAPAAGAGPLARFEQLRIERSQGRSRRIEALEEALSDPGLPGEAREAMRRELLALVERMQLEQELEGLLAAQGLSDAVVVLMERAAEVVVSDVLDRDEAARVGDLVARAGGVPLEGIVIVDGAASR